MDPGNTSTANGASALEDLSLAQRLMKQTQAVESHKPTVEDVVDEEDIAHPPPSSAPVENGTATPSLATQQMSDKAAGKQRAQPTPLGDATNKQSASAPPDTKSEEAFPSLGGSKPQAAAAPTTWSTRPSSLHKSNVKSISSTTNGTSGRPSNVSSGTSTPASGVYTPNLPMQMQMPLAQKMSLPGRETDTFRLPASNLKSAAQLKKSVPEILKDYNRRAKANVSMTSGDGFITLTGAGPTKDAATQAIREIVSQLCAKQSETILVPASIRPHIIGKGGAVINGIIKKTGARVQLPNKSTSGPNDDDDDDGADVSVELEGDPIAIAYARKEIDAIVNGRQVPASIQLKDIPAELFPFIAGHHNSRVAQLEGEGVLRIQVPHYDTWEAQPPPPVPAANEPVAFRAHPTRWIHISGDRAAAASARAHLEERAAELRRQLILSQIAIERGRHQFVIGERGNSLHDFLEETGCSVILPPASEDTEVITIIGPPDRIEKAVSKIEDLAYSMSASSVDIARQHQNAPLGAQEHARFITQYLQTKNIIQELERQHNASISVPTSSGGSRTDWDIYSRDNKNLSKARTEILGLINGHPPSRLQPININPFYQSQIQRQHAHLVRDQYGVHLVFPEEVEESPRVLLVYEGTSPVSEYQLPRTQPSQVEVAEFSRALQEAEQYIMNLVGNQSEIIDRNTEVPKKYQEKFKRFAKRETQPTSPEMFPVQIIDVEAGQVNGSLTRADSYPVRIRGPATAVDSFSEKLTAFIQEQIKDEAERGYTTSADFPPKFFNVLIGKKGENINKLRDEFDVDFQVSDGKVEIKGPKAKADAARTHILALARKLEDETTHVLKVNPKYHRDLIGGKGSQVLRLQERYGVRINFPRASPSPADGQSVADGFSDAGTAPRAPRSNQAVDEIIIKGPKKGADDARTEVLELYQYLVDNSVTSTVSVAQSQLPSLIGQGGKELESMRLTTGAKIDVPGSREVTDPSGRVDVKVKGTKEQVAAAEKLLKERVKIFDNSVSRTMDIDKKHHQGLIGRQGETIRKIITDAGATSESPRDLARYVQFPKAGSSDSVIVVEGDKSVVEKIVAAIQAHVDKRESQVTETIDVPPERHGALIGRGGTVRKQLEGDFNIILNIPSTTTTGPARSAVKITGLPADVAKAQEKIASMLKVQEGETVLVPIRLHHAIADSDNGNFFRNLRSSLKVTVDHAGQQRPPRPEAPEAPPALITNEPETHWELVEPTAPSGDAVADPTIPWILKGGSSESVARAKELVAAALAAAQSHCTGFLTLADPKDNRHVIGAGGATVKRIRADTGASINVPNAGAGTDTIEIKGSREAVEAAKQMVLDAVDEATRYVKK